MAIIKQYPKEQLLVNHKAERRSQRSTAEGQVVHWKCRLLRPTLAYWARLCPQEGRNPTTAYSTGDLLYMVTSRTTVLRKPHFFKGQISC